MVGCKGTFSITRLASLARTVEAHDWSILKESLFAVAAGYGKVHVTNASSRLTAITSTAPS